MREDIIYFLQREVRTRCESKNNFFGMGVYDHVKSVVKYAKLLAEEYNGDCEIVILAAWLHDIASITDYKYYKEHHIWGAKMAGEILKDWNYPVKKAELVQTCILNHRGSALQEKHTIEEVCIADADAISHFDNIPSLFYLAYMQRGYSIKEGADFVKNKLERSYEKLSDRSKQLYQKKCKEVLNTIGL